MRAGTSRSGCPRVLDFAAAREPHETGALVPRALNEAPDAP
jgi:hypothetical protein